MYCRERSVLHFNVADFSVAVERVIDPALREKPLIVAPLGASRAVVHDMSDEAFQDGVRKGMRLNQAIKMCRKAHIMPPRFPVYQKAMTAFIKEACNFTPLVEHGADDGHLYLDITGTHRLFGPPPDVGLRLQREIRNSLRLYPIWTFASNKLVAKVASRLVKPIGEYIVASGEECDFLAPLPLSILPGLHNKDQEKLSAFNLTEIGQLATLTPEQLQIPFGKRAQYIFEISHGIDASPITPGNPKSRALAADYTFSEDTNDKKQIEGLITLLASKLGQQLRKQKREARRVGIYLTYSDGTLSIRQATRKKTTSSDKELIPLALLALQRAWTRRTRLRSCRLTCDIFQNQSQQLSLFSEATPVHRKNTKVEAAMDLVRSKYGNKAIFTGQQHHFIDEYRSEA